MDEPIAEIECGHCHRIFEFGEREILPAKIQCSCGKSLDCEPVLKEFYPPENYLEA